MDTLELAVERRSDAGKGPARRHRGKGRIPAVVYGPARPPVSVMVDAREFERNVVRLEGSQLVRLRADAADALNDALVLVRDIQEHPVSGRILHADFFEVDLTSTIRVMVPIHLTGRAVGVVAGGILQPVLREVEVECLPAAIPEHIEVDVTPLQIHDSVHVRDLVLPTGVTASTEATQTVVTVSQPIVEAAPEEAAAEEGAVAAAPGGESVESRESTEGS